MPINNRLGFSYCLTSSIVASSADTALMLMPSGIKGTISPWAAHKTLSPSVSSAGGESSMHTSYSVATVATELLIRFKLPGELPVVKNFNCISKDSLLPLVKNLYPNKNQLTKTNQQEQQDAGASNADADFYLSIWNELKTHGITRNKKTSEIVKRFAGCEHALDIIRAEAKNIGNDKKNKAGVLVDVLANFDIATYTPPVKTVIRLIDEY